MKKTLRCLALLAALLVALLLYGCDSKADSYRGKADLLKEALLTEEIRFELGVNPAGAAGHADFLSLSDGSRRAAVFSGTGETLDAAWEAADAAAGAWAEAQGVTPRWLKADLVYLSRKVRGSEVCAAIAEVPAQFFRYGIAFDDAFATALLEEQLNAGSVYHYESDTIDPEALNRVLGENGLPALAALPDEVTAFRCFSWLCDEEGQVLLLGSEGEDTGRRRVRTVDAALAETLVADGTAWLAAQVREDGSIAAGFYPRFDREIETVNLLRHASALWALAEQAQRSGDPALTPIVQRAAEQLKGHVVPEGEAAWLTEPAEQERKLGGNALAIVALSAAARVTGKDCLDLCRRLGEGILLMQKEDGSFVHVLHSDGSEKAAFRAVAYDGEAAFALCRLYELTGEEKWLEAAARAADHFVAADYTQHRDHWVSLALAALTRHRPEDAWYTLALRNASVNLNDIYFQPTTWNTDLQLLLATFEVAERLEAEGRDPAQLDPGFDLRELLSTIHQRALKLLNGCFFPELAMYMQCPERILGAFFVRQDGFRVRIDDVQHCLAGYRMYAEAYEALTEAGMLRLTGVS